MTEMIWHQPVSSDTLHEGLDLLLTSVQEDKTTYLLVDTRNLAFFSPADQIWIRKTFLPALSEKQVRRVARLIEPDTLNQAIISNILCAVQQSRPVYSFEIDNFYERGEALEWLLETISV